MPILPRFAPTLAKLKTGDGLRMMDDGRRLLKNHTYKLCIIKKIK